MSALDRALVVGGGIAGMAAAIALRQRGVRVDLIDIDPEWRVHGAGLTITGPTLRAFHRLGILEAVAERGYFSDQVKFFTGQGQFLHAMNSPVLEPGIPAAGGILRPVLHQILSSAVVALGTDVRLGVTLDSHEETDAGVVARTSDGIEQRYDAIVGADGSHSRLRSELFPEAPKLRFTGQGCWRLLAPRPAEVTSAEIYFGPDHRKVGINPCSPDSLYLFATVSMPGNPFIAEAELRDGMQRILQGFGGHIGNIRDAMGPSSSINYRPLFAMLLPPPWHRGRIGLIGDAVHATTPHLASGAGISIEDGLVLAQELAGAATVADGWAAFTARRWERARLVVENSLAIVDCEQAGNDAGVRELMGASSHALAQPI